VDFAVAARVAPTLRPAQSDLFPGMMVVASGKSVECRPPSEPMIGLAHQLLCADRVQLYSHPCRVNHEVIAVRKIQFPRLLDKT
jgi:hypothetical protein